MKNLIFALLAVCTVAFVSCGDDDDSTCKTCELGAFGLTVDTEYCQDGDNVLQTVAGQTDTLFNTTVDAQVSGQEAAGADCN